MLPATIPPRVKRLISRCLQKDPRDRLHDIADARFEIHDVLESDEFEADVATSRGFPAWAVAVAILAGLVIGSLGIQYFPSLNSARTSRVHVRSNQNCSSTPRG